MEARVENRALESGVVRELARRRDHGIDVALLWDSASDRVFVAVEDGHRGERFRIAVGDRSALDVFHHPYAYRGWTDDVRQGVRPAA